MAMEECEGSMDDSVEITNCNIETLLSGVTVSCTNPLVSDLVKRQVAEESSVQLSALREIFRCGS